MIIALSVIMLLSVLAVAILARAMSGQDSARTAQEFAGALGPADAGVADALLRLDQFTGDPPPVQCVGSGAGCAASLTGSPSTEYVARWDEPTDRITVRSKGLVNGQTHAVEAELVRSQLFPFAVFGRSGIELNGNSSGNIRTVDENGGPLDEPEANTGSNGTIDCNGGGGGQNNVVFPGGAVTDCDNAVELDEGAYNPQPPVVSGDCDALPETTPRTPCYDGDTTAAACPANAATGILPSVLTPGTYYCSRSVTFAPGYTTISGADDQVFELFVIPPTAATTVSVTIDDAYVNVSPGATGNENDDVDGNPARLRVYLASSGGFLSGGGSHAKRFVGVAYAPQSDMTNNGCQEEWRGSIVFNSIVCNGGANLQVQYDERVAGLKDDDWHIDNYREIATHQVNLP